MAAPGFFLTQASTFLLVALGVLALFAKPHTRQARGFGWLALGIGLGVLFNNELAARIDAGERANLWIPAVPMMGAFVTAMWASWIVVTPEGRLPKEERGTVAGLLAVAVILVAGSMTAIYNTPEVQALKPLPWPVWTLSAAPTAAYFVALVAPALLLAQRHARTPREDGGERTRLAIMATGLSMMPASVAGLFLVGGSAIERVPSIVNTLCVAAVAIVWAFTAGASFSPRHARTVPWTLTAVMLAGAVVGAVKPDNLRADDTGFFGLVRLGAFLVLGYGILAHRMLGLDVKVRFAVSKSTVAGLFVAVFFVASEAAQQFFGETLESTYAGIAAAGLLVFAMAPLQRTAERLAAKAIPPTSPIDPRSASNRHAVLVFRAAVEAALRDDGKIGPREETLLAEVAENLSLGHVEATKLRHEVEIKFVGESARTGPRPRSKGKSRA